MSRLAPIILLTQDLLLKASTDNPVVRLQRPPYLFDWSTFRVVRWVFRVQSTSGSPTSFTVTPKFQMGVSNTSGYQYMTPVWSDFDSNMNSAMQGGAWTAITAAGVYTRVVYDPPALMQMDLSSLAFVGGTSPGLRCSLIAYPHV